MCDADGHVGGGGGVVGYRVRVSGSGSGFRACVTKFLCVGQAAQQGHAKTVVKLWENGAEVTVRDSYGKAPLDYAAGLAAAPRDPSLWGDGGLALSVVRVAGVGGAWLRQCRCVCLSCALLLGLESWPREPSTSCTETGTSNPQPRALPFTLAAPHAGAIRLAVHTHVRQRPPSPSPPLLHPHLPNLATLTFCRPAARPFARLRSECAGYGRVLS